MTVNWMEEIFGNIDPEDMQSWMEGMGSMMEQWCSTMDAQEIGSWMEEWLPGMMGWCFSRLDAEGREITQVVMQASSSC